jgi:hypothetical protein
MPFSGKIGPPAVRMRGPGTSPDSIRLRKASVFGSTDPRSTTVVKPWRVSMS